MNLIHKICPPNRRQIRRKILHIQNQIHSNSVDISIIRNLFQAYNVIFRNKSLLKNLTSGTYHFIPPRQDKSVNRPTKQRQTKKVFPLAIELQGINRLVTWLPLKSVVLHRYLFVASRPSLYDCHKWKWKSTPKREIWDTHARRSSLPYVIQRCRYFYPLRATLSLHFFPLPSFWLCSQKRKMTFVTRTVQQSGPHVCTILSFRLPQSSDHHENYRAQIKHFLIRIKILYYYYFCRYEDFDLIFTFKINCFYI